jgi:3-dehydroquinate synthase
VIAQHTVAGTGLPATPDTRKSTDTRENPDTRESSGTRETPPAARSWSVAATRSVSYEVRLVAGLLDPDNDELEASVFDGPSRRRLIVVEQTVFALFGDRLMTYLRRRDLPAELVCVAADEARKGQALAARIVDAIDDFHIDRRHEPIVAIGGGVLLDVVGWVASFYRRGTPYVKIPTTLIGLVDAGVGIKTGINHNGHKNRLGTYHPPVLALLDPQFLATLPSRHISNGLAEIAKIALMRDAELWELLNTHGESLVAAKLGSTSAAFAAIGHEAMTRAVHGMLAELRKNLWETNLHRLVDFGHTFSPALEMASLELAAPAALLHGEAVAVDMAISCTISARRGLMAEPVLRSVLDTLSRLGLPLTHPACSSALLERALADTVRHRGGWQRLPVPVRPGTATFIEGVGGPELAGALRWLRDHAR